MDWFSSSRRQDKLRYVRVDWDSRKEIEELDGILTGEIERNDLTSIKSSGSLNYVDEPDIGRDFLRIYSDSYQPQTGERVSVAHGTYLVSTPSSTYRGAIEEGTADLYSVLQVLAEDAVEEVLCLPAGTVAVSAAAQLITGAKLPVVASANAASLNADAIWDAGTTKLEIINWLMAFAGFSSAQVDGYGNVRLAPYSDPTNKTPVFAFTDDDQCVFKSGIVREYDIFNTANVITVVCSNSETGDMTATAINDDPLSAFSTVSRGRRIVRCETISDVDNQEALQVKADSLLVSETAAVESFEIEHVFVPLEMGDIINLEYNAAGLSRSGLAAVRQTMQLRPGMECKTRFRRFVRS